MNIKHLIIRIFSIFLGLVLGIGTGYTAWYLKNSSVSENSLTSEETEAFINGDLWDRIVHYIETESSMSFIEGYNSIYFGESYSPTIESILTPYYEKYGTETVIIGALRSKQKLGIAYGIEKCCELIGHEKMNLTAISEALDKVIIEESTDRQHYASDYEYENSLSAVKFAKDRLQIAKALAKEDYKNDIFIKNTSGTRMAWVINYLDYEQRIRIYDNKSYYTSSYIDTAADVSQLRFLSDDIVIFNQGSNYGDDYNCVIYIHNGVHEYHLSKMLYASPEISENIILMYSQITGSTDYIVQGEFSYYDSADTSHTYETKTGTFSLNLKNGDLTIEL